MFPSTPAQPRTRLNQASTWALQDAYRRLTGSQTGAALLAAFQACPHPEVDFDLESVHSPVRDVVL